MTTTACFVAAALLASLAVVTPRGDDPAPYTLVLGIAQDAGFPQAACARPCCAEAWVDPARRRLVASLAIIDPASGERWIIDATPDFREQLRRLDEVAPPRAGLGIDGILLTHAHIGHYTGLMFLGHESIGAVSVPVHGMPRMRGFLATNGPWEQLVRLRNIRLEPLEDGAPVDLNDRIRVTPFLVPHRDEYSETVGFRIEGPARRVVYLPDIDKWERWATPIEDILADADVAYLDGTFHAAGEIPGRDMTQIPHPFVTESLERFAPLPAEVRERVRFIHLNHTNPALDPASDAARAIRAAGCGVAEEMERVEL